MISAVFYAFDTHCVYLRYWWWFTVSNSTRWRLLLVKTV